MKYKFHVVKDRVLLIVVSSPLPVIGTQLVYITLNKIFQVTVGKPGSC